MAWNDDASPGNLLVVTKIDAILKPNEEFALVVLEIIFGQC